MVVWLRSNGKLTQFKYTVLSVACMLLLLLYLLLLNTRKLVAFMAHANFQLYNTVIPKKKSGYTYCTWKQQQQQLLRQHSSSSSNLDYYKLKCMLHCTFATKYW